MKTLSLANEDLAKLKLKNRIPLILAHLRQDSRMPILEIARKIGVPKSTVYDHYRKLRERYWFTVVEQEKSKK